MSSNSERIAKNVVFLYIRMLVVIVVQLFTARIVLRELGATDYGIYNVVAGFVSMMAFFTGTMTSAVQRFFSFEIGKGNYLKLNDYFIISLLIFAFISLVSIIILELFGLPFINSGRMKIPIEDINAANCVFHCSIFALVANLLLIPYNSLIIAYEKMNVYAYISLLDVIMKLLIAFVLVIITGSKLEAYALLIMCATIVTTLFYAVYCKVKFKQLSYYWYWNRNMFKELMSYTGWNLIGTTASVMKSQGVNVLLSMFFTPVVNASRALAFQVNTAIDQLYTNFFSAVRPQIVKQYANNQLQKVFSLLFSSSKLCFFLTFIISLPFLFKMDFILTLWLGDGNVPEYACSFLYLVLIDGLINSLGIPLISVVQATGKVKKLQIYVGGVLLLNLPLSYLALSAGAVPELTFWISIILSICGILCRLLITKELIRMSIELYFRYVLTPLFITTTITITLCTTINMCIPNGIMASMLFIMLAMLIGCVLFFVLGLTKEEKKIIKGILYKYLKYANSK